MNSQAILSSDLAVPRRRTERNPTRAGAHPKANRQTRETPGKATLTPKQERFALLVATGYSQADGYRQTYDCSQMADKSVHEAARQGWLPTAR